MVRRSIAMLSLLVAIAGVCVAAPPSGAVGPNPFVISPTALDFGQVRVGGTSGRLAVDITNVSSEPIRMSGSGGGVSSPFSNSTDCTGKTLLVGATCHEFYRVTPQSLGAVSTTTTGTWNGQSYTVQLVATGAPRFAISATALDFGDVTVGTAGPPQTITITNLTSPVVISMAGGGAGQLFGGSQDCQGKTLRTNESCHIFYRFQPSTTGIQTGSTNGNINGQPFAFNFTGNGVPEPGGDFIPVAPTQLLDTSQLTTRPSANQLLKIGGVGVFGPVPTDAKAIDLTVRLLHENGVGTVTVWPCNAAMPALPTIRFTTDRPIADHVAVQIDSSGLTCLEATKSLDLIVSLDGYYTSFSTFTPLTPHRIRDTRPGRRPSAGSVQTLSVIGGSVPVGAAAVALNLTAMNEGASGHLTAYPCGTPPKTSALQYHADRAQSAPVVVKIGSGGKVCVRTSAAADMLVDVVGYYAASPSFTPTRPSKILDTAAHLGYAGAKPAANQVIRVRLPSSVPADASAAVVDITATAESGAGIVQVYGCGQTPTAPVASFPAGTAVTNLAVTQVFSDGRLCVKASRGAHLSLDLLGWYA